MALRKRRANWSAAAKALNPWSKGRLAQSSGAAFEARILHAAACEDLLCVQNGLRAKWVRGRLVATPTSQLDMLLLGDGKKGEIAMVDAKVMSGRRFGRSRLTPHQLYQAGVLAGRGLTSGFIVHMPEADDAVTFFAADLLLGGKDRQGFCPEDGIRLGSARSFFLRLIWSTAADAESAD